MAGYLLIKARLPLAAGLELSARLMAARPFWDIEVDGEELSFFIALTRGRMDAELALIEEALCQLERKNIELADFWVSSVMEKPVRPSPASLGPLRLESLKEGGEAPPPRPDRLILPNETSASKRFWAGESLALSAVLGHLRPPPGAPETRGKSLLSLSHGLPLLPAAALLAGARDAVLLSDEAACEFAAKAAALNGKSAALSCVSEDFMDFRKNRDGWQGRFGLIVLHLSPYLAVRRLKYLVPWLAEDGVMIISGFAPGPQTAQLLRAAARAGLSLSSSDTEGPLAAMKLEPAPAREELPPLTGSVLPALVDPPPGEAAPPKDDLSDDEIPDEESLMLDDEGSEIWV